MSIRLATAEDAEVIAHIEADGGTRRPLERLLAEMHAPQSRFHVLEEAASVVAYVHTWWVVDAVEIIHIAAHPEHRRQGHGRRLLEALAEQARRAEAVVIHLEVRESNVAAQGLYSGLGYQLQGRRRGYYPTPEGPREDALLMSLSLAS
ncbi:MAG: ribosomal protein S18-alanine N-acetyltransferase [Bradymonadia bacterium]